MHILKRAIRVHRLSIIYQIPHFVEVLLQPAIIRLLIGLTKDFAKLPSCKLFAKEPHCSPLQSADLNCKPNFEEYVFQALLEKFDEMQWLFLLCHTSCATGLAQLRGYSFETIKTIGIPIVVRVKGCPLPFTRKIRSEKPSKVSFHLCAEEIYKVFA